MPASMISAPTGGRPKVIGSSMAMVASEPMPGSTPISVPTSAPSRQKPMLFGMRGDREAEREIGEKISHDDVDPIRTAARAGTAAASR